jgi:uncharacterized repeat protein (TIGR01451 family)
MKIIPSFMAGFGRRRFRHARLPRARAPGCAGNLMRRLAFPLALPALFLLASALPAGAAPVSGSSLGVGKTVDHTNDLVGNFFTFTVTVTNAGPGTANGTVVQDSLPGGLQLVSSTPSTGSAYNGASGAWTINSLPVGGVGTLSVVAQIVAGGAMTNTATTSSSGKSGTTVSSASVVVFGIPITGLLVSATQLSAEGKTLGPLAGASVLVSGAAAGVTSTNGQLLLTNLSAGTYTVTVTNAGYYAVSHTVVVTAGQRSLNSFQLLQQSGPGAPSEFDFISLLGNYFLPATPGNLTFSIQVAWNGTPGSAVFNVNGTPIAATLTGQGNGTATALVTVPIPALISAANQLTVAITNGEGLGRAFNLNAYFEPLPGLVSSWYTWLGNSLVWVATNTTVGLPEIAYNYSAEFPIISNSLAGGSLTLGAALGVNLGVNFAPFAGTIKGSVGATGSGSLSVLLPGVSGVEVYSEGSLGLNGTLEVAFAGLNLPKLTPGWGVSLNLKNGVRAPVVAAVPVLFPAAAPAVTFLQNTWGIKNVVNSLKVGVAITEGGAVTGVYQNSQFGSCFLKTTALNQSATAGLELEAGVELGGVKAKIYGGGNGTLDFGLCPEVTLNSLTLQAYVGVSASAYIFTFDRKFTATLMFGGASPQLALLDSFGYPIESQSAWEPIGNQLKQWGAPDQLATQASAQLPQPAVHGLNAISGRYESADEVMAAPGSTESLLVSNVLDLTSPSVFADSTETDILFADLDPTKPWYASTDIGVLRSTNGGAWSLSLVADDVAADFNPKVIGVNSNLLLAAWERLPGDLSGTTNPVQVESNLEIAVSWFDRDTGVWSTPVQLTTNLVVDRDPLPVVFGATQGILWVENQAGDILGDSTNGDSLLFSEWTGTGWTPPETLWPAQNGLVSFSFVADGSGQGHVVFAVDQDDLALTNIELHSVATAGGGWQPAVQLTDDEIANSLPTLVAPNGVPICVWDQGGTLTYTPLNDWNPKPVFVQTNSTTETPSLTGVTLPGGAAVGYAVQSLDGVAMYVSFYNAAQDNWSLPRQLTDDDDVEDSVSLAFDGTNLLAAFDETETLVTNLVLNVGGQNVTLTNAPLPGRTDLYLLTHAPATDPGVLEGSLSVSPPNPAPGSNAIISAIVENFGDVALQNVQVAFYDGNPAQGGVQIGSTQTISSLIGGMTQEVDVTWSVPFGNSSHTVEVVVDPAQLINDANRTNNTASLLTVLPDLAIDSTWSSEEGATTMLLEATVVNEGVVSCGPSVLTWELDSTNGVVIGTNSVGPLAPGQSVAVTCLWNTAGFYEPGNYALVYAVADSLNQVVEFDETNNDSFLMVPLTASWVPQITGVNPVTAGVVQFTFAAANSSPSDFVIESTASLAPPMSWQPESGATITEVSPGIFQVQVSAQGAMRFYHVKSTP